MRAFSWATSRSTCSVEPAISSARFLDPLVYPPTPLKSNLPLSAAGAELAAVDVTATKAPASWGTIERPGAGTLPRGPAKAHLISANEGISAAAPEPGRQGVAEDVASDLGVFTPVRVTGRANPKTSGGTVAGNFGAGGRPAGGRIQTGAGV